MAFANLGKDRVRSLPLSQIMVNPAQPRTRFEDEALQQLAQSIAANGLLQPVTVREAGPGKYQLVAGERRCGLVCCWDILTFPPLSKTAPCRNQRYWR